MSLIELSGPSVTLAPLYWRSANPIDLRSQASCLSVVTCKHPPLMRGWPPPWSDTCRLRPSGIRFPAHGYEMNTRQFHATFRLGQAEPPARAVRLVKESTLWAVRHQSEPPSTAGNQDPQRDERDPIALRSVNNGFCRSRMTGDKPRFRDSGVGEC